MSIFSTLDHLQSIGAEDGWKRGIDEGVGRQLGKLLLRHGKRLLEPPSDDQRALLDNLVDKAARPQLEQILDRLLEAPSWTALLAGIAEPAERPTDPVYLLPYEFDPEPMTSSVDEYFKVSMGETPAVVHLRFQKLYQENIGALLHADSRRLQQHYSCKVETVVLILWPGADGPAMTGEYQDPKGEVYRYHLTRLWEKDADEMFDNLGTVAFAALGRFAPERLPEIVRRMDEAIEAKSRNDEDRTMIWFMAYSSMGLRYSAEEVNQLLAHKLDFLYQTPQCRRTLSDGYYEGQSRGQEEGRFQAMRQWVLTLGRKRLGEPPAGVPEALEGIRNLDRLEQLASRVLKGTNWQEVLAPS